MKKSEFIERLSSIKISQAEFLKVSGYSKSALTNYNDSNNADIPDKLVNFLYLLEENYRLKNPDISGKNADEVLNDIGNFVKRYFNARRHAPLDFRRNYTAAYEFSLGASAT